MRGAGFTAERQNRESLSDIFAGFDMGLAEWRGLAQDVGEGEEVPSSLSIVGSTDGFEESARYFMISYSGSTDDVPWFSEGSNLLDLSLPATPGTLTAIQSSSSTLDLAWDNPKSVSGPQQSGNETGFKLQYAYDNPSTGTMGDWSDVPGVTIGADVTSIQLSKLGNDPIKPGEHYHFRIAAVNANGESLYVSWDLTTKETPKCPTCGGGDLLQAPAGQGATSGTTASNGNTPSGGSTISIAGVGIVSVGMSLAGGNDNSNAGGDPSFGGSSNSNMITLERLHDGVIVAQSSWCRVYFNPERGGGGVITSYAAGAMNPFQLTMQTDGTLLLSDDSGDSITYAGYTGDEVGIHRLQSYTSGSGGTLECTSYDGSGNPLVYTWTSPDGQTEDYTLTYGDSAAGTALVTEIALTQGTDPTALQTITLTYYGSTSDQIRGIRLVTKTTSTGGVEKTYNRYDSNGLLVYSVSGSSYDSLVAQQGTDLDSLLDSTIAGYATDAITYDSLGRIVSRTSQGSGCSNCGGFGTVMFTYAASGNADSFNNWATRRVDELPGWNTSDPDDPNNVQVITYSNYLDQPLLTITDQVATGEESITAYHYDSSTGLLVETIEPSAIDTSYFDLTNPANYEQYVDLGITEYGAFADTGLIETTQYYGSTTASLVSASTTDDTTAVDDLGGTIHGGVKGYVEADYVQQGLSGTAILQDSYTYFSYTGQNGATVYPLATSTVYSDVSGPDTGARVTSYRYVYYSGSMSIGTQLYSQSMVAPIVSTDENGPGSSLPAITTTVYDLDGRVVWTQDANGSIGYMGYDDATGAVVQSIEDVNTNTGKMPTLVNDTVDLPDLWATPEGYGLNLITTYQVDSQGRTIKETDPNGGVTYTVYDDADHAVFTLPGATETTSGDSVTLTTAGPISMERTDIPFAAAVNGVSVVGSYDENLTFSFTGTLTVDSGTIVLPDFIRGDSASTGPVNVLDVSSGSQFTIQSLSRTLYNASGQTVETDAYASIDNTGYLVTVPNSPYSGAAIDRLSGVGNYAPPSTATTLPASSTKRSMPMGPSPTPSMTAWTG